ncbi:MAG: hypothetical protein Q8M03_04610 [Legionella sp.]|nr:hypothetical protein [Legionella sp.]
MTTLFDNFMTGETDDALIERVRQNDPKIFIFKLDIRKITPTQLQIVANALQHNTIIHTLHVLSPFTRPPVGWEKTIKNILTENTMIKKVRFTNSITAEEMEILGPVLSHHPSINDIELHSLVPDTFSNETINRLADALMQGTTKLNRFSLTGAQDKLTSETLTTLINLITSPVGITIFELVSFTMDSRGIEQIASALRSTKNSLLKLKLNCTTTTKEDIQALAELLSDERCVLNNLHLGRYKITNDDVSVLIDALTKNNSLKKLLVDVSAEQFIHFLTMMDTTKIAQDSFKLKRSNPSRSEGFTRDILNILRAKKNLLAEPERVFSQVKYCPLTPNEQRALIADWGKTANTFFQPATKKQDLGSSSEQKFQP